MKNWPTQSTLWQITRSDCQHPGMNPDVKKSASGVVKSRVWGGDRFMGATTRKRDWGMGDRAILPEITLFNTQFVDPFTANQIVINQIHGLSLIGPGTPYRSGDDRLQELIPIKD